MSVTRYFRPFDDVRRLEEEISDIFRTFHSHQSGNIPVNIWKDSDEYRVRALLPGFNPEDIDIQATSQSLEIEAKREMSDEEEDELVVQEIASGTFRRRINFDKPVNTNETSTTMQNGVITITLPIMEEAKSVKLNPELIEA